MKSYVFNVDMPADHAAGLWGFTDTVIVAMDSGDPGGEPGEFERFMENALAEWFDGAGVTLVEDGK